MTSWRIRCERILFALIEAPWNWLISLCELYTNSQITVLLIVSNTYHTKFIFINCVWRWHGLVCVQLFVCREKMAQAYDFALDKIGMDVLSYPIWVEYIAFLKSVWVPRGRHLCTISSVGVKLSCSMHCCCYCLLLDWVHCIVPYVPHDSEEMNTETLEMLGDPALTSRC